RVLRRLRPVRRLRSVVRGGARRAEDRRGARALPRADVRRHEDRPLPARLAAAAHDSAGVRQVQVDGVMPLFPRAYALARRAGLVHRPWFDAVFSRSYFLYKRWLEDPFHGLARRSPELFRGGHVVDVGANIGYTAVVFARAVEPGRRVLALEPEARNFALLEKAIARWGVAARGRAGRAAAGAAGGTSGAWAQGGRPRHPHR